MTEHTKEPWQTWGSVHSGNVYVVAMPYDQRGSIGRFNRPEDAARSVATVNATAGIPTEALEAGIVGEMVEAMREASDLLAERTYGNPARSPAHNARVKLDALLSRLGGTNGK